MKIPAQSHIADGTMFLAEGDTTSAIKSFKQAILIQPHHLTAHNDLGLAYLASQRYLQSIESFNQAIKLNPKLANLYKNLGKAYRLNKNFQKSLQNYQNALSINQDLSEVYDEIGILYIEKQNNKDKAIEYFLKAIQKDHCNLNAYNNLTKTYIQQKEYQKGINTNKKALAVNIQSNDAQKMKAQLMQIQNQEETHYSSLLQ